MMRAEGSYREVSDQFPVQKKTYCEFFGIRPEEVNEDMIRSFFEHHQTEHLDELIAGYTEMANLNSQITHDFESCDAECDKHFFERL
ncbi:hypothetical protein ABVF11_06820 [Pediococcus argentinicus]|uniref:hypothetical protein n=1 Tax=Pediococcus argentinicus TaxID=480391 RepID=UPI00338E638D